MAKRIIKRVVPLIGVVALLLNLAVVPQRARAVAVTAAVAASAAAILTACGVSYWAATQTDAVDYIAGKIDDYLASIDETGTTYEDWLEISGTSQLFEVVSGGVMRFSAGVANKLLDFCRWLQDDEGIESGGSSVVSGGIQVLESSRLVDGADCQVDLENGVLSVIITGAKSNNSNFDAGYYIFIPVFDVDNPVYYTLSYTSLPFRVYGSWTDDVSMSGDGSNLSKGTYQASSYNSEIYYKLYVWTLSTSPQSGTFDFSLSGATLKNGDAIITPSDFFNVPAAIDSDAVFSVKPSVDLASGDSVDDAAEAILDGITSEDGLLSTVEETPGTAWGWLYTLLSNIAGTIGAGVSDIKDKLDGIKGSADNAASAAQGAATASQGAATAAQGAASAAQDAATAAQGVQDAVEGMQSTVEGIEDNTATIARNLAPATYGNVADYQLDLTSLFPFCIPRDIYTAIGLLVAEPEAPSIDWDIPLPNGSTYHIEYDLSDWDGIASLLRHLELLLYGVGLMMATKSIIKW